MRFVHPAPNETRTLIYCAIALCSVIALGTVGFMIVEPGWGLWKSFFFTLVTVTTVGYGDEGLSFEGQAFAAVLLIGGIATATYSLSSMVRVAINLQLSWRRKMRDRIKKLNNHFVICGYGRIGETVCEEIATYGIPFVVLEKSEESCQAAQERGFLTVRGNSTEDDVLRSAGIDRAKGVICVINSDAENVFITLSVRELNPEAFIACRAAGRGAINRLKRAGASLVISPYTAAGMTIADEILTRHRNQPSAPEPTKPREDLVQEKDQKAWERACEAVLEEAGINPADITAG